jgi:hypothetical protein
MKTQTNILNSLLLIMGVFLMLVISCKKESTTPTPTPTTPECPDTDPFIVPGCVTYSQTWAKVNGEVQASGGSITSRGVCWSTSANPSISDFSMYAGSGDGSFSCTINGLNPGKTYYVRLFAITCNGVSYGGEEHFTTVLQHNNIRFKVTNLNYSDGDEPSISCYSDGRDFKKVSFNCSEYFEVEYSDNPKLYIWSCPASCYWKQYSTPLYSGGYLYINENGRNLRIDRESGK